MVWLLLGVILGGVYGFLWAWMLIDRDDDAQSIRDYEAAKREVDGWFE